MLIAEYDYDMDIKVQREEAKEEGIEQGIEQGRKVGKAEGIKLGTANAVIELLKELGTVPTSLKSRIIGEEDDEILKKWLKLAAKSETIEEFEREINR